MKKSTLTFIILSAFFIATAPFVYAGKYWEYKDWSVSSNDNFVRYIAHGDTVYGHQFGFIKKSDNCDSNILWISVSTQEDDLKALEGVNATIQLKIDETQFQAELEILAVNKITPTLTTIGFSNFLAGEKFIALLEKGQKAEVTILAPEELLKRLDLTTDTFSLKGFTATMLKAKEFCESKSGPSIDHANIPPDISTKAGQGDSKEAAKWYREAAELGDADAQYFLGLMYYHGGLGVTKDYAQAVKWFRKAADQGNADAQTMLGGMYSYGPGVTKDYAQAVKLFRKAADQGIADAQFFLGLMYFEGKDVTKDYTQAAKWFKRAADQGNDDAQYNLGRMYSRGDGVTTDYAQAAEWYKKAADQGNDDAQYNLGSMYLYGKGVPKDEVEAAKWIRKAAEQGDADAQLLLGLSYLLGKGVPQDKIKAYEWNIKSARQGNTKAQHNLDILCKESPWACK